MNTAIVIVSHSRQLAAGVVELASQMGPDVPIRAVGGRDGSAGSPELGTDFDGIVAALTEAVAAGAGVVVLTDLGSATLTAQTAIEVVGHGQMGLADAPLVEGAVAAVVAAQSGAGADDVRRAAEAVVSSFTGTEPQNSASQAAASGAIERTFVLGNELGLHARSAALLARLVSGFQAEVTINGVDAASVFALMALGLVRGDHMAVSATGAQAGDVLVAIERIVKEKFGEE